MHSIFISDLHLSPDRARINEIFFRFLSGPAARAEALYILGDLFEYWAGDDDDDPFNCTVLTALRGLADGGVALYLMHGNRDFLIGEAFAMATGVKLIDEVAKAKGVEVQLEKIEDMQQIMTYGVMSTPGVVIDGKVVHAGGVPTRAKVEAWL